MFDREIRMPAFLRELHGERATPFDLAATYAAGLGAALFALSGSLGRGLPLWKPLLLALLFLDIGGGVVANFTKGTRSFYRGKPRLRRAFVLLHLAQPALLALAFPELLGYCLFAGLTTVAAALLVDGLAAPEKAAAAGALFTALGIVVSLAFPQPLPAIAAFAPLYLVKLVLGLAAAPKGGGDA